MHWLRWVLDTQGNKRKQSVHSLPPTEEFDAWACPTQVQSSAPFLHAQSATLQEFAETDHHDEQSRGHDNVIQRVPCTNALSTYQIHEGGRGCVECMGCWAQLEREGK